MKYTTPDIAKILNVTAIIAAPEHQDIKSLAIDSRKILFATKALFIAIETAQNDGHAYVQDAYNKGVRNFLVHKNIALSDNANVIQVNNTLDSLQAIAAHHKSSNLTDTVAVIGSNGKTIIKEWLSKLLIDVMAIVKSPKSYNSQIGVALSIWNIQAHHDLAILEAGISTQDEMIKLEQMIRPNTVILSNIGDAHDTGFTSRENKLKEKITMARSADTLIYCADQALVHNYISLNYHHKVIRWATSHIDVEYQVSYTKSDSTTLIELKHRDSSELHQYQVQFIDHSSLENITHCLVYILSKSLNTAHLQSALDELRNVEMRLALTDGGGQCQIVNDSYSADLASLTIALDFLDIHKGELTKTVILSEFEQNDNSLEQNALSIIELIKERKIDRAYLIGESYKKYISPSSDHIDLYFYNGPDEFLNSLPAIGFHKEIILVKGARKHQLERVVTQLELLQHRTILEINLSAISHNLSYYRSKLHEKTIQIAVIKAEAYGSGADRIAHFLQDQQVDYIAVAYADEGVGLRNSGIHLPIMVLTPDWSDPSVFYQYQLEPQIYHIDHLRQIENLQKPLKVHLNIDTGMNRLGFGEESLEEVKSQITKSKYVIIRSIFSHLRASEDTTDDEFTHAQIQKFEEWSDYLSTGLDTRPFRHILNSSGILRFPHGQFDAVRFGLGLYGLSAAGASYLERVHSLYSRIIQIKKVKKHDTIGYGRKEVATEDMLIGIIPIGYADGILRMLGLRRFEVYSDYGMLPIVGNINMDMTIVDLTRALGIQENTQVEFFGRKQVIETMASAAQTISYEILSRISPRVKRVFVEQ